MRRRAFQWLSMDAAEEFRRSRWPVAPGEPLDLCRKLSPVHEGGKIRSALGSQAQEIARLAVWYGHCSSDDLGGTIIGDRGFAKRGDKTPRQGVCQVSGILDGVVEIQCVHVAAIGEGQGAAVMLKSHWG